MSYRSTAALLDAMKTRIEALTPDPQFADDDRFRVVASVDDGRMNGHRSVTLIGAAGVRKTGSNRNCREWVTQVEILISYGNIPTEDGEASVLQRAIQDAEDVLNDLYVWSVGDPDVVEIRPDMAIPQAGGDGEIIISRSIGINFLRT